MYLRDVTERVRTESELRLLVDEQAALRRVATLVAAEDASELIVDAVTQEIGQLLGADAATLLRFGADDTATIVSDWNSNAGAAGPRGHGRPDRRGDRDLAGQAHRSSGAGRQLRGRRR